MPRFLRSICLLLIASCLLAACGRFPSPGEERRHKALTVATETYRKLMRWGYYEEASQYLKGKGDELPRPDLKQLAHYKISSYNSSEELRNDTGDEVRVIVFIEYYDIDSGTAKTLRDEQYWWFDAEQERWFLGSPMPVLGAK